MKKIIFGLFVLCIAISGNAVYAGAFEITPYIGYMFDASIDVTNTGYSALQVDAGTDFGFSAGGYVGENVSIEFMWNRVNSSVSVKSTEQELFNMNTDQYNGNFLYNWGGSESKARPYALIGIGATHFNPHADNLDLSGITKFNMGFGGGVKTYFSKNFGLRFEARYTPTYLNTTDEGFWCDPFFGCYAVSDTNWLNQFDVTVGTIFRF